MPTVLHLPGSYLPTLLGGKEIYTHTLAKQLTGLGWTNYVALHQVDGQTATVGRYEHEGIPVHVLPAVSRAEYVSGYARRVQEIPGFNALLQELRPDVVHFHDFSWSVNLNHLDDARASGAKTMMTFHSPGQACQQTELLYAGTTVCDGELRINRCTECRLQEQGLPGWLATPLSRISLPISNPGNSKLTRGLTARRMTTLAIGSWQEMIAKIDRLHVYAQWLVEMMQRNRVPPEKLAFFRTGLPEPTEPPLLRALRDKSQPLKIIMPGRCEPFKGQQVLIEAVQQLPQDLPVEVSFLGPYWDSNDYGRQCLQLIAGDSRFHQPRKVPPKEVAASIAQADVMAVPSLWLETGPLVVLEAFAQRVPVLGSHRGGIAELVQPEQNGWLFPAGDVAALRTLIEQLITQPAMLDEVRQRIRPPRTMRDVARDTAACYEQLLGH